VFFFWLIYFLIPEASNSMMYLALLFFVLMCGAFFAHAVEALRITRLNLDGDALKAARRRNDKRHSVFGFSMLGGLVLTILVAMVMLDDLPKTVAKSEPVGTPETFEQAKVEAAGIIASAKHDEVASNVDDVIRATGYKAHIFPDPDHHTLIVVSEALSEGEDKQLLLTLLGGNWKTEFCAAGYTSVRVKGGLFASGTDYGLACRA